MNQAEIKSRVLLKLYEAFFLSFDYLSLRGLDEEEGCDRTTFRNVLDRLTREGAIRGRPGGAYVITGAGAVHAEETGFAPRQLLIRNQKVRAHILNVLAKVYEEKGHLYSASMSDISAHTNFDEIALKSNRQVLMDLNLIEAPGNAQFKITYLGLDAVMEYRQKVNEIGQLVEQTSRQTEVRARTQVFFSYSRKDKKWLERFQATLKPLIRANQISVWDDTKIKAGDIWRDKIKQALASAKVAVLLVSTNFLNSDFISENELPPLLEVAQKEGLRIILVVVGHSLFEETELGRYQAVNDPARPLASILAASREREIVRICKEIKSAALETNTEHQHTTTRAPQEGGTTTQPDSQGTLESKLDIIFQNQQRTEEKVDQLLKSRGETPRELLSRYPLGYVIFELDYENRVLPYAKRSLDQFDFDWNVAKITRITDEEVDIRLSNISRKEDDSDITGLRGTMSKRAGAVVQVIAIDDIGISAEVVAVRETGIVFLVGFEQVPLPDFTD